MLDSKTKRFTNIKFLQISVFWFAQSFQWGAILGVFLQKQVLEFVPPDQKGLYLSILMGAGSFIAGIVLLIIGHFSDNTKSKWGRRIPYMFWGTLLSTIPLIMMGAAQSFLGLVAAYMLTQFFANVAVCPFNTLIPELVPKEQQGTASAWMSIFLSIGQAAGPAFAGYIMMRSGGALDLMIFIAVILNLLMIYTLAFVKEEPIQESKEKKTNSLKDIFSFPFKEYPDFSWLLVSRTFINMGQYTALGFLMYFIKDSLNVKDFEMATGILLMVLTLGGIMSAYPAGILSDKFSKKTIVFTAGGFASLMAVLFSFLSSYNEVIICGILLGIGFGAFATANWALLCNLVPREKAGKFMGVWNLTFIIPQAIAPLIAGYPSDYINTLLGSGMGYRVILILAFVYIVIGLLAVIPIRENLYSEKNTVSVCST